MANNMYGMEYHLEGERRRIEAEYRRRLDEELQYMRRQYESQMYYGKYQYYPSLTDPLVTVTNNSAAVAAVCRVVEPKPPLPEDIIIEAVVGYRAWAVPLFGEMKLTSIIQKTDWPIRKRLEAKCSASSCSGISCSCGIYAFKKLEDARKDYGQQNTRYPNRVLGSVSIWGRVLECENGYRGQFAYPKEIINTGMLAQQAAEAYRIPCITLQSTPSSETTVAP